MDELPPGLREIRYFAAMVIYGVFLFVLGVVLSETLGFTILADIMRYFLEDVGDLWGIAGLVSFLATTGMIILKAREFLDSSDF